MAEGDAQVRGDAELLRALLRNLVENALRHGAASQVRVSIIDGSAGPMLAIADDGKGIEPAEREAVLQRFRRGACADSPGSGLGLSIVQRIAELHGARLELADGIDGRGVELRLGFPRAA